MRDFVCRFCFPLKIVQRQRAISYAISAFFKVLYTPKRVQNDVSTTSLYVFYILNPFSKCHSSCSHRSLCLYYLQHNFRTLAHTCLFDGPLLAQVIHAVIHMIPHVHLRVFD